MSVVSYGSEEERQFDAWRRSGIRVGTNDLRIAACAVSAGAIVVTRNRSDFEQIPDLTLQDWSVQPASELGRNA